MASLKFSVHPLFFLFGLYYALTGKIFIFLIYTFSALAHELGHSLVAASKGYQLNKLVLMPYGAIISGDTDLSVKDQTVIAMAGPIVNLSIALLFVAGWWIYPESYAFTDVVAEANFTLAIINFLPVFPLDGGRILYSILSNKKNSGFAKKTCKIVGIVFSVILTGLFILNCFYAFNLSSLFFVLFVIFGAFSKIKDNGYIKILCGINRKKLKRGIPYKKQAIADTVKVKDLLKILDKDAINEIVLYGEDGAETTLSQKEICEIVKNGEPLNPIKCYIDRN